MHPLKRSLLARIEDMPPEFVKAVDDNFWKLIESPQTEQAEASSLSGLLCFPFTEPSRVVEHDGSKIWEWQSESTIFELEKKGDSDCYEIMVHKVDENSFEHWELKKT